MYGEEEFLPLSALQHFLFCERQCALIHVEGMWRDNVLTAEGTLMHRRAHGADGEMRGAVRREYGVPLRSRLLGLSGVADVVEFTVSAPNGRETGNSSAIDCLSGVPFPVEYKRGRPKAASYDAVQLCAQAICLEEMLSVEVPCGALFYGRTRRRQEVAFDRELRELTHETAYKLHEMVEKSIIPLPIYRPHCDRCSFIAVCLPKALSGRRTVKDYIEEMTRDR